MVSSSALTLLKSQKDWVNDRSRLGIFLCCRQGGKTYSTALKRVDRTYEAISQGRSTQTVVLSRSERQSRIAMKQVIKHCKSYNATLEIVETKWRDQHGSDTDYLALEVRLPNDSSIIGLPANPDTARGNSANLWLDEFAIHRDSREIWGGVYGLITRGYELDITSTPEGLNNKFAEIWHNKATKPNGDSLWSKHFMDIYQAVDQGLVLPDGGIAELKAGLDDDELWEQEYECKFLDGAHAWLSMEIIHAAEHDKAGIPGEYQGGQVFIGIDIALRKDLFVIWVWEVVGDVFWCREIITMQRSTFDDHDQALEEVWQRYPGKIARICVDQTAMGEKPVFDWKKRYGDLRVEGVIFGLKSKQHLAILGKQAFEDRRVRIPMADRNLINDLHKLKRIVTPAGNARFDAERDSNGHADRTWACFLGIYAADRPKMVRALFGT
jgi:phage FluMu gp28-like protein